MRVFSLLCTLCLLGSTSLRSQSFIGRYNNDSVTPYFTAVTSRPDGAILAGGTGNFQPRPNQALLSSLTPDGGLQWTNAYGDDLAAWGVLDLLPAPDGDWIVLFGATNNPGFNGFGAYTIIAKIAAQNGAVVWARRLGTNQRRGYFNRLLAVEGGYVLGGTVEELNQESSFALAFVDESGDLLWQNAWKEADGFFSQFTSLAAGPDGEIWALGASIPQNGGDPTREVLARFSPAGELELARTYEFTDGVGVGVFAGVTVTYRPGVGPVVGALSFLIPGGAKPALLQADSEGDVVWARILDTPPDVYSGGRVLTAPDGSLILGSTGNELENMALLVELDGASDVRWAHTITADYGVEVLFDLKLDERGNILGAGQAFAPPFAGRDGVVFKVDDPRFDGPSCCTDPTPLDSRAEEVIAGEVPLEAGLSFEIQDFDLAFQSENLLLVNVCETEVPAIALSDTLLCPGQELTVSAPDLPDGVIPQWILRLGGTTDTFESVGPVQVFPEAEGDLEVLLIVDSCSRETRTVRIEQRFPPVFTLSDTLACPGECLEATISEPEDDPYIWVFNGAEPDSAFGVSPPLFCYPEGGQFAVELWIEGCGRREQMAQITYIPPAFPNAFTPNGDGDNDIFNPVFPCEVEAYDLRVYNRWGQEVFRSTRPADGWDGTDQGDPAPSDVYVWALTYQELQNGEPVGRQEQGEVVLLR